MAQSLTQSVINRIVVNQPADYKDESYSGNLDVSSINSMLIHCRKENVRVFARITATQVWNVLGVVGDALDSVSGMGTEYRRDATFDVALMDRVSITSLGSETKARVIFNPTLPASLLTSSGGGASVTEHAMTNLVTGEDQTVAVGAGDAFVQVYNVVPPLSASPATEYTGVEQSFVVPAGITSLTAQLWGAGGGSGSTGAKGAAGGYIEGTFSATPGETLTLVVGEGGHHMGPGHMDSNYGGAGNAGPSTYTGHANHNGEGGGLAGIFRGSPSQGNAILIAGGGGGSHRDGWTGGTGGPNGSNAHSSAGVFGAGGTQSAGGAGAVGNRATGGTGSALVGGHGRINGNTWYPGPSGGAGYFGGGGGIHGESGYSGAGGGSNYAESSVTSITNLGTTSHTATSHLPPEQSDASYIAYAGQGGDPAINSSRGGGALVVISYSTGGSSTLEATTTHTIAHDSTAGTVTITPASNVANAKLRIVK